MIPYHTIPYHISDAHGTTLWLNHVICSQDMQTKLHLIAILDMLPSSDHVPLSFVIVIVICI